eukprot:1190394-Amphidinium_carterae.1
MLLSAACFSVACSSEVQHVHEQGPHMILKLNAYASGMLRMRLTEIEPLHPRCQFERREYQSVAPLPLP